jgi:hypothetical protein
MLLYARFWEPYTSPGFASLRLIPSCEGVLGKGFQYLASVFISVHLAEGHR